MSTDASRAPRPTPRAEVRALSSLPASPWRNGGGTTRQLAVAAADAGPGFSWRLSQAELIGDAEFSPFPGVGRVFTLLSAGPVRLAVDGESRTVPRGEPQRFSGETEVSVSLRAGTPEKALNLMLARGLARGDVQVIRGSGRLVLPADHLVAVVVIDGALVLRDGRTVNALEAILPSPRAHSGTPSHGGPAPGGGLHDGLIQELDSARAGGAGSVTVAAVQVFPGGAEAIG
ncbi:environmental stress-induced protein Ves [Nesterenkonia lutea]|uniref:Environmental stress-induced protein Ves n=1 Tax=Nesterenkonia lutea TaxID=272919 RepID=A0ABR9JGS1_9MICC|nr:HutD family protein [Nesterenkonia lutea]MBE1525140.1 environmental stress-induced protein Ves [Nesterenkonia lutea]